MRAKHNLSSGAQEFFELVSYYERRLYLSEGKINLTPPLCRRYERNLYAICMHDGGTIALM